MFPPDALSEFLTIKTRGSTFLLIRWVSKSSLTCLIFKSSVAIVVIVFSFLSIDIFSRLNISIERKEKTITTIATDDLKIRQVNELLETHLIRRKVDPRVLIVKNSESASGGNIRQISKLKEGISQENAKKIIGDI